MNTLDCAKFCVQLLATANRKNESPPQLSHRAGRRGLRQSFVASTLDGGTYAMTKSSFEFSIGGDVKQNQEEKYNRDRRRKSEKLCSTQAHAAASKRLDSNKIGSDLSSTR
jgi:hypothetical protein